MPLVLFGCEKEEPALASRSLSVHRESEVSKFVLTKKKKSPLNYDLIAGDSRGSWLNRTKFR